MSSQNLYSSKIKDIYIELKNFKYFHKPSSIENIDERIIGRVKEKNRLKDILLNSDTESGTYLITGFRGMGKTSLVNLVLNEIVGKPKFPSVRYIRVYIALFILSFFKSPVESFENGVDPLEFIFIIAIPLIIFIYSIITIHINNKYSSSGERNFLFTDFWKNFVTYDYVTPSQKNVVTFSQDYILLSIPYLLGCLYIYSSEGVMYQSERLAILTVTYLIWTIAHYVSALFRNGSFSPLLQSLDGFFLNNSGKNRSHIAPVLIAAIFAFNFWIKYKFNNLSKYEIIGIIVFESILILVPYFVLPKENNTRVKPLSLVILSVFFCYSLASFIIPPDSSVFHFFSSLMILFSILYIHYRMDEPYFGLGRTFKNPLTRKFNRSNVEIIHINLGKDDLDETYILKQIVQHLCFVYGRIKKQFNSIHRFIWFFIVSFLMVSFTGLIFYQKSIYSSINEFKQGSFTEYFPSQSIFELTTKLKDSTIVLKIDTATTIELANEKYLYKKYGSLQEFKSTLKNITKPVLPNKVYNKPSHNDIHSRSNVFKVDQFTLNKSKLNTDQKTNTSGNDTLFSLKNLCNYVDFWIFLLYQDVREFLSVFFRTSVKRIFDFNPDVHFRVNNYLLSSSSHSEDFRPLLPIHLDYLYITFFCCVGFVYRTIINHRNFGLFVTHEFVYNRLTFLKNRINAQVSQEKNMSIGWLSQLRYTFSRKNSDNYPIADFGTIESELVIILRYISKIPSIVGRPKFIFVFDELDKIEPYVNTSLAEKEAENDMTDTSYFSSTESHRNRQQLVSKILANLKHFFNTVNAKFIFIAGREMFDASLADASNRESFIRSIFNEVLYINSFYTDGSDGKQSDITSMTEAYVCHFLYQSLQETKSNQANPNSENYSNLKAFHNAIKDNQIEIFIGKEPINPKEDIPDQAKVKILFTLKNFITYLTYRSNGSPKNITQLFEQYVIEVPGSENIFDDSVVLGKRFKGYYLHFTENDQYKFGLTSRLFTPFLNNQNYYLKSLGDKLLVSSAFLFDHLFKFHRSAFSRRNLELTPEIININKAPQLRDFIQNIVGQLTNNNLRLIVNGMHEYKFQSSVKAEIDFISKISELESAAFNFTLDESLQTKKHYKKKLYDLRKSSFNQQLKPSTEYINSIGYLNMLIGELHFYDQEYDEALKYFMSAIQELKSLINDNPGDIYNFTVYTRNTLKLGLTFEKQQNFESALLTYEKLTYEIIKTRSVEPNEFGIIEELVYKEKMNDIIEANSLSVILEAADTSHDIDLHKIAKDILEEQNTPIDPHDNLRILYHWITNHDQSSTFKSISAKAKFGEVALKRFIFESKLGNRDKMHLYFLNGKLFSFDDNFLFILQKKSQVNTKMAHLDFKKSLFENLRLCYQPILAKLAALEKGGIHGLSFSDLKKSDKEFYYLLKPINSFERSLLLAEYYNKVGDILFYKNGLLTGTDYAIGGVRKKISEDEIEKVFPIDGTKDSPNQRYYKAPYSSFFYYYASLYSSYYSEYVLTTSINNQNTSEEEKLSLLDQYCELNLIHLGDNMIMPLFLNCLNPECEELNFYDAESEMLKSLLKRLKEGIGSSRISSSKISTLNSFANGLSDLGDAYFSFANGSTQITLKLFQYLNLPFESFNNSKVDEKKDANYEMLISISMNQEGKEWNSSLNKAIIYFFLSYQFYEKAGKYRKASHQLTKILYLLKDFSFVRPKKIGSFTFQKIEKNIFRKAAYLIHRSVDHTIRPEKLSYSDLIDVDFHLFWNEDSMESNSINPDGSENVNDKNVDRKYIKHSSINSSLKELYFLMAEINLNTSNSLSMRHENRSKPAVTASNFRINTENCNVNPFISIDSRFIRIFELFYKVRFNFKVLENHNYLQKERINDNGVIRELDIENINGKKSELEPHLIDSIYCLNSILGSLYIFGPSYLFPHSTFGLAHYWMGDWCRWLKVYLNKIGDTEITKSVIEEVCRIFDDKKFNHINSSYQYDKSREHFYLALQTHNEGQAYQNFIEKMYYLDDDLNDDFYHFFTARERYKINNGSVEKQLKEIAYHLKKSQTYDLSIFFKNYSDQVKTN